MKFKIGDKIYDGAAVDDLSLKMLLKLEKETTEFGHPLTHVDIARIAAELQELKTAKEQANHPDALWLTAVGVWAARNLAGEEVSFDQAVDFPMSALTFLPDPQDRKKPANPQKARPGSGRAAAHPTQ